MARAKDGILGDFSGKVGNVVGCKGKTGYYVRSRPQHVSNPQTERQQAHRARFAVALQFARMLSPFLRVGYREMAGARYPFHAAVSFFLKNAVVESGEGYAIDYARALVSHGSLTTVHQAEVQVEAGQALYEWMDNSGEGNASAGDAVLLLVFNKARQEAVYSTSAGRRSDGKAQLSLPGNWEAGQLVLYLGFCSADGEVVANSVCLHPR